MSIKTVAISVLFAD